MTMGSKIAFVEVDTIGSMLELGWNLSSPKLGEWEDLIPLYLDNSRIWCFNSAIDVFVKEGWLVDDPSKRIYKKLRTKG